MFGVQKMFHHCRVIYKANGKVGGELDQMILSLLIVHS